MSRTHTLAGEGNVGYADLAGSLSAVVEAAAGKYLNEIQNLTDLWHTTSLYSIKVTES